MRKFLKPINTLKSFVTLFIVILLPSMVKCQNYNLTQSELNHNKTRIENTNDSSVSYDLRLISIGYQKSDYEKVLLISSKYFLNISFRNSSFYHKVEDREIQVGLFNEYGIKNLSVYFDFGPEMRMLQDFYVVPSGGVSLSLNKGLAFIFFDSYIGTKAGFLRELSSGRSFEIEMGIQANVPETEYKTIYLKIGIGFNL